MGKQEYTRLRASHRQSRPFSSYSSGGVDPHSESSVDMRFDVTGDKVSRSTNLPLTNCPVSPCMCTWPCWVMVKRYLFLLQPLISTEKHNLLNRVPKPRQGLFRQRRFRGEQTKSALSVHSRRETASRYSQAPLPQQRAGGSVPIFLVGKRVPSDNHSAISVVHPD